MEDVLRSTNDIGCGFGEPWDEINQCRGSPRMGGIRFNISRGDGEMRADEPRTPMENGYKGLAAKCSREGIIDYCLSTQKILSAKKVPMLRKVCQKKGMRYTRKPEIIDVLATEQVKLAYEGFVEVETEPGEEEGAKVNLGEDMAGPEKRGTRSSVQSTPARVTLRSVKKHKAQERSSEQLAAIERVITTTTVLLALRGQIHWLTKYLVRPEITASMLDLKEVGVYIVASPWSKKVYVGSTIRSTMQRWREHLSNAYTEVIGSSPKLYRSMRHYGPSNFVIIPVRHANEEDDQAFERHLIQDFSPSRKTCNTSDRGTGKTRNRRKGKRERKRLKTGQGEKVKGVVSFTHGRAYERRVSLKTWLEEEWIKNTKGERRVQFHGGEIWSDGWREIKRLFGMTKVRINGRVKKLSTIKGELQQGMTVVFIGITKTTTTTATYMQELRWMLKKPILFKKMVSYTTNQLVGMYRATGFFREKKTKNDLRLKIDRAVKKKTGVGIRKRVQVKVTYDKQLVKREIRQATEGVVGRKVKDAVVANQIKGRVRVTWKRNRAVGEIIHNHRKHAHVEEQLCICRAVGLPTIDKHVFARFSDLKEVPVFMKNNRNVTCSSKGGTTQAIVQAIVKGTSHLGGKMEDVDIPAGGFMSKAVTGARGQGTWAGHVGRARGQGTWDEEQVAKWCKRFEGLVLAPMDHNQGDTTVICPVIYRHAFGKTFVWNCNYEDAREKEQDILLRARNDFKQASLHKIAAWKTDGRIGRAYVIPKDKDLDRWRPIAPATGDPAGTAQRKVAKALHYLMKLFPKEHTFYLNLIQELPAKQEAVQKRSTEIGCTGVEGRCYDIKDMLTKIPHDAVRRATDGYVGIRFESIFAMVEYDLNNAYVNCGQVMRRQISGIPMGKCTSPILATITCAMAEFNMLKGLGSDGKLVGGWRIVDDITVVVGRQAGERSSNDEVFGKLETSYDENLTLVRKDGGKDWWHFLGGSFYLLQQPVRLMFVPGTKNVVTLREIASIRYHTMQDYASYLEKKSKKSMLAATLKRLWSSTSCQVLVIGSIAYMSWEAYFRGYAPKVSLGALAKLVEATSDPNLRCLLQMLSKGFVRRRRGVTGTRGLGYEIRGYG
ncbi:hypothetical protein CBR_g37559 [Chara braunii]|uniref:GIY-YIG domain-containing protein n=1 Tax=Chara braunii TaxID=69332 RepID=A0A388LN69_CHABU|nr:hypothetical protein CBR_g37559 [Chara braunii]|eukprot:GBG83758.1 hypothetical protein CBR_g37559 [Chara braunii]